MNFESLVSDLISVYKNNCNSSVNEEIAKDMIRSFMSLRDTESIIQNSPRHLFQSIFENNKFYGKSVIPCDIIELRKILSNKIISKMIKISAFTVSASERVIKDQKIRIVLNKEPKDIAKENKCGVSIFGGFSVFDTNKIDISNSLHSIIVENVDNSVMRNVEKTIKEIMPECPVYSNAFIAGIDKYRFASGYRLFEINLPSLGIFKEKCRASDPSSALGQVLAIKWDRHPDKKKYYKRPDNYTVNYWKNSGFMASIVREIGKKNTKANSLSSGEFDPSNPPHSEKPIFAVMDYNGDVFFDLKANMHGDVVDNLGLDSTMIVDGGFIIDGKYNPRMSNGGWTSDSDSEPYLDAINNRKNNGKKSIANKLSNKEAQTMSPQIQTTTQEEQIFSTLLDINKKMNLGVTFRVAGGWVRDKLLGTPSDDIDIALDKMTGQQFVNKAIEYKNLNPQSPINIDSAYVVKQNSDKSKHLETTAIDIAGLKIDFVNLRNESYGDSRIPTMEISDNPEVDAQRRDLTINSLFYNINNKKVEDYVGGLKDLQNMIIRTPLDPKKTFMDDPLRVLRVFRFFSRYPNAKIDQNTLAAMSDPSVHESYRKKVSPERAGPEILKMFGAKRPAEAIRLLFQTGMDKAVFDVPETKNLLPLDMNQRNSHHKFNLLEHTLRVVEHLDRIMKQKKVSEKDRILMLIAAVFHDYGKAHPEIGKPKESNPNEYSYVGHEEASASICDAVLKRIGIGEDDRKFVSVIVREHMRPHTDSWTNKSIGRFMRDTQIPGNDRKDLWEFVMMHAQADTMAKSEEGDQEDFNLKEKHALQMREYLNRPQPIQMKPLVDGNVLQKMFSNIPIKPPAGGISFIKYIQNKLLDEQLSGNILDQDQAIQYVESLRQEIESMYGGKKAESWYGKVKKADASSGSSFGTAGRLASDSPSNDSLPLKRMIYRDIGESSMVSVGDRYRSKGVGVAFEAGKDATYKVVSKDNGYITLQDEKGKKHKIEIGSELPAKFIKV